MGKFDGVLVASDYDGTLYDANGVITKKVREAIAYYISQGGRFTVSTGRTLQGFHAYDPSYINAPVLLVNGGIAYDYEANNTIFSKCLGEESYGLIRAVRDNFPTVSIEMYCANRNTFAIHMSQNSERHFTSQGIPFSCVDDPAKAQAPWSKVMFGCHGERSQQVQQFIKENSDDPTYLPTSGDFIELMRKGVNKGSGLLLLAELLGISQSNCYAVGDGYNDVDMLVAAARGFVPLNGCAEALAVATDIVRPNTDDTVANVIEILDTIY